MFVNSSRRVIKVLVGIAVIFSFYILSAIYFMASARIHELVAYQIIQPNEITLSRALPMPLGKRLARWFMVRKSRNEISEILLYEILRMPEELAFEGQEQGFSVSVDAEDISLSIADELIALGLDVNATNRYGCTSLHLSIKAKDVDAVKFLLDRGVDKDKFDKKAKHEFCRVSPIQLAMGEGGMERLLEH